MNYGIALLSPGLGLAIMGFLTGEWTLCLVVQTIGDPIIYCNVPIIYYAVHFA